MCMIDVELNKNRGCLGVSHKVVVCDGFSSMIIRVKKLFDFF